MMQARKHGIFVVLEAGWKKNVSDEHRKVENGGLFMLYISVAQTITHLTFSLCLTFFL